MNARRHSWNNRCSQTSSGNHRVFVSAGEGDVCSLTVTRLKYRPESRGGTSLYKLHRYVPPHRVGVMARFGLKTGIHFAHFGLESGMVFGGTTGMYERIDPFNFK